MKPLTFSILLLLAYNFNDAYGIQIIRRCDTRGTAFNVKEGNRSVRFLVAADGPGGVVKFNPYPDSGFCDFFFSQNANAHFPTSGTAYDALVIYKPLFIDPVLFVADGESGLTVFTGDTGTDWMLQKQYPIPGISKSLAFFNTSILVAGDSGLFVFSLPCSAGTYCQLYNKGLSLSFSEQTYCRRAEDVAVESSYAYVITEWGDIVFCNLEKPEKVTYVLRTMHDTCAISLRDGIAYTATSGVFAAYDILFPYEINDPPTIGYNEPLFQRSLFGGHGEDVVLFGNLAYIAARRTTATYGFNGLVVYEIADLQNPRLVDSCSTPGTAYGIFVDSAAIYLADGDSGIAVLSHPVSLSTGNPGGRRGKERTMFDCIIRNQIGVAFKLSPGRYGHARIRLFAANGTLCRTLKAAGRCADGTTVRWDYTNDAGRAVSPGMYFAVMEEDGRTYRIPVIRTR